MIRNTIIFCFLIIILSGCAEKVFKKEVLTKDHFDLPDKAVIDISGTIAFDHWTGAIKNDTIKVLTNLISFLRKYPDHTVEVFVYHVAPSQRFVISAIQEGGSVMDYIVNHGIEESKVTFNTSYDKKKKFPISSPYRRVEIVLVKVK